MKRKAKVQVFKRRIKKAQLKDYIRGRQASMIILDEFAGISNNVKFKRKNDA